MFLPMATPCDPRKPESSALTMKAVFLCLALLVATTMAARAEAPPRAAAVADTVAVPDPVGDAPYYFYKRAGEGSDLLTNPLRLILNGGFGIIGVESRSNVLGDIDYANGWENLWLNLGNPIEAIEEKGWWDFFSSEVIPVSFNSGNAQYWPNYWNHLLGGGFSYRLMREWYRAHGFAHESRWALTTMVAYHLTNETVEMDDKTGWRVDPIADVYIFDVAGILLFESDRVARFFGETMNMSDWSLQPFYDPRRGRMDNIGLKYMMRLRLGRATPWHLFYHWGNSGELGLSRDLGGGHFVSAGAGWLAANITDVDGISETAELANSFGMFYDRGGSLMASALYSRKTDDRWRLNLYPGLVKIGPLRPGLTFIDTRSGDVLVGVTLGNAPLVPFGYGGRVATGNRE